MRLVPCACLLLLSALPAQRLPDPVDASREIQIHDLRPVFEAVGRDPMLDLAAAARTFLRPPLGDATELQLLGPDLLVLRGDPEQQVACARMLRTWSEMQSEPVSVTCEVLQVPQAAFAGRIAPRLGWTETPHGGGGTVGQEILDQERGGALRAELAKTAGAVSVQSPQLTLLPLRTGTIQVTSPVHYRRDVEIEVVDGKRVVWPITGVLQDGFTLKATVAPLGEDTVGVDLEASLLAVTRPIPTFETTVASGMEKVVIDLPQVTVRHLAGTLRLGEEQLGVLVGGTADDQTRILLLVRAGGA